MGMVQAMQGREVDEWIKNQMQNKQSKEEPYQWHETEKKWYPYEPK